MFWTRKTEKPSRFVKIIEPCIGSFFKGFEKSYPGYKDEAMDDAERLAFHKDVERVEKKIELILDHLELEFEPEKNVTEPAKLAKRSPNLLITELEDGSVITGISGGGWVSCPPPEKPKKKKRGRPKGSKNKKK